MLLDHRNRIRELVRLFHLISLLGFTRVCHIVHSIIQPVPMTLFVSIHDRRVSVQLSHCVDAVAYSFYRHRDAMPSEQRFTEQQNQTFSSGLPVHTHTHKHIHFRLIRQCSVAGEASHWICAHAKRTYFHHQGIA